MSDTTEEHESAESLTDIFRRMAGEPVDADLHAPTWRAALLTAARIAEKSGSAHSHRWVQVAEGLWDRWGYTRYCRDCDTREDQRATA